MNGATPIHTQNMPAIDVKKIVQTIRDIATLARFRHERDDVLQERAHQVAAYLNNTDRTLRESFPVLLTALDSASGQSHFAALEELWDALGRHDLSAEDRALVSDEVRNLKATVEAMLDRVETRFCECARRLENEVHSVYKVEIDGRADDPLKVAKSRKTRILAELNEHARNKALCTEQRDTLIKAQEVIREFNLADMYKNYIPSGEALDGIDMENPKKEAVKQGIELVRKVLGMVSEGIKYMELATARGNLDREIEAIAQQEERLNDELDSAEDGLSDALAVVEISRRRRIAGEEVMAVANVWKGFAMAVERLRSTDYTPRDLTTLLNRYHVHIETLSIDYNAILID
ncbi:alpha-xenorhabdolysin family binary toxin subunit B [Pseudomonas sp. COR58]|uniref:Alpha-xenorhabdolysin family binary toxin subunit B n=1 Tax=Pseudomonas ekonensis TaxID=2842353 RepID=A0ABS6PD49_9PSED|nr:alpha-xenorhabdolysin family binary toxin subunit B [Pseudomonas ekonensis]MBV4458397.1 alpha-xenorhabdolysin family binary toxin subunit B [Pseudomonas ekonensis]